MYRKRPGPSNLSGLDKNPDYTCPDLAELPVLHKSSRFIPKHTSCATPQHLPLLKVVIPVNSFLFALYVLFSICQTGYFIV